MTLNKAFILASRPTREQPASPENFRLEERQVGDIGDGEVLVKNQWLSLDPYMRGRMNAGASYAQAQPLGEVMTGQTVGEVVASRHRGFSVGDQIVLTGGWQLYRKSDGRDLRKIDGKSVPPQTYLGVLGMPGVTAWYGVNRILEPRAGQTVVVSAATGAVGGVVGQIAKAAGARVVGIAGGAEKCGYAVDVLGYDACVDHRSASFAGDLAAALPKGIDALFENVGGAPFAASIRNLNDFARIAVCGLVASGYDGTPTPLPDVGLLLQKRALLQGFIISDHLDLWPTAVAGLAELVKAGKLKWRESVAEGLEAAPEAFFRMLKGGNFGKQLVRIG